MIQSSVNIRTKAKNPPIKIGGFLALYDSFFALNDSPFMKRALTEWGTSDFACLSFAFFDFIRLKC